MKKIAIFTLFFLFCFNHIVFSENFPLKIKADNFTVSKDKNEIYLNGNVKIYFKDTTIEADSIIINTIDNFATAEGDVVIKKANVMFRGTKVQYSLDKNLANISNYASKILPDGFYEPILIRSESVVYNEDKIDGEKSTLTTCDLKYPHYFMKSNNIKYYPEDKVSTQNSTFYVNNIPVLWLPFFEYSLKKQRITFLPPAIGENNIEGKFIKSTFNYFYDDFTDGSIYLDYLEKKGWGKGFSVNKADLKYPYKLLIYNVPEIDTGLNSYAIKYQQDILFSKKTKLSLSSNIMDIYLLTGGRTNYTNNNFLFNNDLASLNTIINYKDESNRNTFIKTNTFSINQDYFNNRFYFYHRDEKYYQYSRWTNNKDKFIYNTNFLNNYKLDLVLDKNSYTSLEGANPDDRLDGSMSLSYSGNNYSAIINYSFYKDLDEENNLSDTKTELLLKNPEIIIKPNRIKYLNLYFDTKLEYANFTESKYISSLVNNRIFKADRLKANMDISNYYNLTDNISLNVLGGLTQYLYTPGDKQYVITERLSLLNKYSNINNNLMYERIFTQGNSPFFFDGKGNNSHFIRDSFNLFFTDKYNLNISSGYNYLTNKYFDLDFSQRININQKLSSQTNFGWNIENGRYKEIVESFTIRPNNFSTYEGSFTYNPIDGEIKSASSLVYYKIGEKWEDSYEFKIKHVYDFFKKQYNMEELLVKKDLHCFMGTFSYNFYQKEFKLIFSLKALPDQPVEITAGKGLYIDYFNEQNTSRF